MFFLHQDYQNIGSPYVHILLQNVPSIIVSQRGTTR